MTIKSKVAAVAFTLMIASPAFAQTGAAVTTNAGIAPVQAQTGIDAKIDSGKSPEAIKSGTAQTGVVQTQPAANVPPAVIGSEAKIDGKVEHKDMHGKMTKEAGKELNKDGSIKTDSQAVVK